MRSIRAQLVLSLTAGVLVLAGAAGAGLYGYVEEALEHGIDAALAARADAIAADVHLEDDGQPHLRMAEATATTRRGGPFAFQIWRADGRTLARVVPGSRDQVPLRRLDGRRKPFADATLPDGATGRVTQVTFTASQDEDEFDAPRRQPTTRPAELLTLVVWHDRRLEDQTLAVLLSGLLFAAAIVVFGILAIVTLTVRRGLRPLADVSRLADRIGPDSLDARFAAGDALPAELRPIASKLNDLLDRLQSAFARERRFSAAVAHELRTPVAELRSLCEVTLRGSDDPTAAVAEAQAIAVEMGRMVQAMLSMGRVQAGVEVPRLQVAPLGAAVNGAWAKVEAVAVARGLSVNVDTAGAGEARVDAEMLAVILRNLLGNAVDHATGRGRVRVGVVGAEVRVGNTCDALVPEDLPRLFEPFWRKSAARTGAEHVGLGLSLVEAYCRAMGASVDAALGAEGWFEVTVRFRAR